MPWLLAWSLTMALAAPAPPAPEIVVAGDRQRDRQVRSLLRQVTPRAPDHPLARLAVPPCVSIRGFKPGPGLELAQRVQADFQLLKLPPAGDRCRPNLWITVVDPPTFADLRRRARPLAHPDDPVLVQRDIMTHSADGDAIQGNGTIDTPPTLTLGRASRIGTPIRLDLTGATLVFSSATTLGKTPGQLADYAVMRLFAETDAPTHPGVPTITALFASGAPAGLTPFDLAYLQGLYAGSPSERPGATFGHIRARLRAGPDGPADPARP